MTCIYQENCGGCCFRDLEEKEYRLKKEADFKRILSVINQPNLKFGEPVFISDGARRRASMAFLYKKGKLVLGFNQRKSNELVDVEKCTLITPAINAALPGIKNMLTELCVAKISKKDKKKIITYNINAGDLNVCEVDNGLDIVLDFDFELSLEHRMIIFEASQNLKNIIRVSHRRQVSDEAETIIEKTKPFIKIADYEIFIPAGTFLQASKEAEQKLISLVQKYMNGTSGKIADLFCGVGTFSYSLAANPLNKITAVDSSEALLKGFRYTINKNMIANIEVINKNLFKYPLDEKELASFVAVVFDPPRAGAANQVKHFKNVQKIVAVSCNPQTFVNDANAIIANGYNLDELTLVDQFTYSNHSELVAVFTRS